MRLAIYAEDLLLGRVRPAGEVARFGGGGPIAGAEDAGDVDPLAAEELEEFAAAFVVADDAYRQDARAEFCEIVHGVGCAAGIAFAFAMAEDQDGGFARDAGDFAGDEFVEDEVAYYADGLAGEGGDEVEEAGEVDGGVGGGQRCRALALVPRYAGFRSNRCQSISVSCLAHFRYRCKLAREASLALGDSTRTINLTAAASRRTPRLPPRKVSYGYPIGNCSSCCCIYFVIRNFS